MQLGKHFKIFTKKRKKLDKYALNLFYFCVNLFTTFADISQIFQTWNFAFDICQVKDQAEEEEEGEEGKKLEKRTIN